MRKTVFGIIYAGEENMSLRELVKKRSVGALPVGGRYRVIDFVLSNMVNSGIRNVAVIPRRNYHSMMDHLGSGKEWDLNRKNDGLFLIPPYDTEENCGSYRGMFDTLRGAASYIRTTQQKYCLLSGCTTVHNETYNAMFDFHVASGADITMLYSTEPASPTEDLFPDVRFRADASGRVTEMKYQGNPDGYDKMGMGIYLIRKDLLQYLVEDASARGKFNLVGDVIMNSLGSLKVYGFEHTGYTGRIRSVASYFKLNMDFLDPEVQTDLFYDMDHPIYTKIKDEAPTRYSSSAHVTNCVVGSGCNIEGTAENCVLFRGLSIAKGAVVKNSVIMQSCEIHPNSKLSNVILDKCVTVRPNSVLAGSPEYPIIIPKGASV